MENTSDEDAEQLLTACLNDAPPPPGVLGRLLQPEANRALFRIVVERLADLFEPRLCDVYAKLFSEVIARTVPHLEPNQLWERYQRIRQPRRFTGDPDAIRRVFVLSRVTLGADVAVTSIVLDTAKRLFQNASISFVGANKNWELFAADSQLEHTPLQYGRSGTLADRLAIWPSLTELFQQPDSIVIDPDSRLTQLGLLPVCPDENYFFFESRSYGQDSNAPLPELTKRWLSATFGVEDARSFIAPLPASGDPADVTINVGVGENDEKRVPDPFEEELLRLLAGEHESVLIDRGAGGEEAERVEKAVARCGANVRVWDGSFAGFAAQIARSSLYVGYDSAGGHVAAACGVPLISVFRGEASERMLQRWRPSGPGPIQLIRASDPQSTIQAVEAALQSAL